MENGNFCAPRRGLAGFTLVPAAGISATLPLPTGPCPGAVPMEKNPLNKGVVSENARGIGEVTAEMIDARAVELATIAGRVPLRPTADDFQQARRELTGEHERDPREESLDALPESERWNPVPGSDGQQAREAANEDEDEEGRSETEQLVDEGVKEAEHDQMLQASRAALRRAKKS